MKYTGEKITIAVALIMSVIVWIAIEKDGPQPKKEIDPVIIKPDTLGQSRTDLTTYEFSNGATSTLRYDWETGEKFVRIKK